MRAPMPNDGDLTDLVADWLLQNDWMAHHKARLSHPAAWVHGGVHALAFTWALDWRGGLVLGLLHVLIDTRVPLTWWIRAFKHSEAAPDEDLSLRSISQTGGRCRRSTSNGSCSTGRRSTSSSTASRRWARKSVLT